MKKIFLILSLSLFSSIITYSQKDGTVVLGGNISYASESFESSDQAGNVIDSDYNNSNFTTNIKLGYIFFKSNLEVGLGFGYSHRKNFSSYFVAFDTPALSETKGFTISPYIKKYISVNEKFSFTLQIEYSTFIAESDYDYRQVVSDYTVKSTGLRPGFIYFITKHIGLNANLGFLGYTESKYKDPNGDAYDKTKIFNFNFGLENVSFGASYFF